MLILPGKTSSWSGGGGGGVTNLWSDTESITGWTVNSNTFWTEDNDTSAVDVGGSTADRLWHDSGSAGGIQKQVNDLSTGSTYNFSFYAKSVGTYQYLRVIGNYNAGSYSWFWDLVNGTTGTGTTANHSISSADANGFYRVSVTISGVSFFAAQITFNFADGSSTEAPGNGTSNYGNLVGFQLTEGATLESYAAN